MALNPPSPQTNVPRDDVGNVVDAMLLDVRVKWIAVVFEATVNGVDQFTVTPYINDPTLGG
jgi:hypothetical protein